MAALIRFIADTGLAPEIDLPLDFVAADVCAAAIRHISVTAGATGRTYHLASPENAPLGVLVGRLRDRGYRSRSCRSATGSGNSHGRPPVTLRTRWRPSCRCSWTRRRAGLTVAEMYLKHIFPSYTRTNTERALQGSGIAFAPVSGQLLDSNIDRLMRTGYLPARRPVIRERMSVNRYPDWASFVYPAAAPAALPPSRGAGGILRGPERGERPRRVPAGHHPAACARRIPQDTQRGPLRGPGSRGHDRHRRRRGGRSVLGSLVVARPEAGDRADGVHLGRNVRKRLRHDGLRTTANAAFRQVARPAARTVSRAGSPTRCSARSPSCTTRAGHTASRYGWAMSWSAARWGSVSAPC